MPHPSGRSITAMSVLALATVILGVPSTPAWSSSPSPGPSEEASPQPIEVPGSPGAPPSLMPIASGMASASALPTDPALFGTGLVPVGWQIVEDATSTCRIAVPADWTTGIAPGVGQAGVLAEGLAAVSADTQPWDAFTQTVDQFYLTGHEVLVDTSDVFLIANPSGADLDLSYVLGLRSDDVNCMVLVTVQRNAVSQFGPAAVLVAQTLAHIE